MSTSNKYQPGDIEHLLLSKSYAELTKEELMLISEFASNEKEYSEMKSFMANVSANVKSEFEVVPSNRTKDLLLAEFDKPSKKGAAWWSSIGAFLFPKGKNIFGKPGIQFGLMAALVIGFFTLIPSGLNKQDNLAMIEEEKVEKPAEIDLVDERNEIKELTEEIETEKLEGKVLQEKDKEIAVLNQDKAEEHLVIDQPMRDKTTKGNNESLKDFKYRNDLDDATVNRKTELVNDAIVTADEAFDDDVADNTTTIATNEDAKYFTDELNNNRAAKNDKVTESMEKVSLEEVVDLESVSETSSNIGSVSPAASLFKESVVIAEKKKEQKAVVHSKSLSEEDDLLDLLYTAM